MFATCESKESKEMPGPEEALRDQHDRGHQDDEHIDQDDGKGHNDHGNQDDHQ